MSNTLLNCFVGKSAEEGKTKSVVVNGDLISSVSEEEIGIKVTLTTGEVFLCSDGFVSTVSEMGQEQLRVRREERMFQFWKETMSRLATETYEIKDYDAKETKKRIAIAAEVVTKLADEWDDFRSEVM